MLNWVPMYNCCLCGGANGVFCQADFNTPWRLVGFGRPEGKPLCELCVYKVTYWDIAIRSNDGSLSTIPFLQEVLALYPWQSRGEGSREVFHKEKISRSLAQLKVPCTTCAAPAHFNYEELCKLQLYSSAWPEVWRAPQCEDCKQAVRRLLA